MTSDNLDLHHLIEGNSQLSNYLSGSAQIIDTSGIDWGNGKEFGVVSCNAKNHTNVIKKQCLLITFTVDRCWGVHSIQFKVFHLSPEGYLTSDISFLAVKTSNLIQGFGLGS